MKLMRVLLPVLVLGIMVLAPQQAAAATATFFGPIIPPECHCDAASNGGVQSAPDFGCVLATVENGMNFAISIGVIIFVLVAAYAGLLWMFSPMNPHNREMGRGVLMNAVIGLLIALCAWLMVDFIMKTLYNDATFGPWNSILGDGNQCLVVHEPRPGPAQPTGDVTATGGGGGGGSGANCPAANPSAVIAFPADATNGSTEKATAQTVHNFMSMRAAAQADGISLKVTDGYRSEAEQVALWNQYGQNPDRVAKPCSLGGGGSNHNSGTAVDITIGNCHNGTTNCHSAEYNWLKAHGAQYGFRNSLPADPVHWSPSGS